MGVGDSRFEERHAVTLFLGVHEEVVQLASVYEALVGRADVALRVVLTGEDELGLARGVESFAIEIDQMFSIPSARDDQYRFSGALMELLEAELEENRPDVVLLGGQSSSSLCAALTCHQKEIPLVHVGAGVRGPRSANPPRDEVNCVMIDAVAQLNFAATGRREQNLLEEGVDKVAIRVVGDTADDSLRVLCHRVEQTGPDSPVLRRLSSTAQRWIVFACDPRIEDREQREVIFESLRHLAIRYHDVANLVVPLPVHVQDQEILRTSLQGFANVHLIPALGHVDYVWLAHNGAVFITNGDGGKLALHRPAAILRQILAGSEFQPALAATIADLERDSIVDGVVAILEGEILKSLRGRARNANPSDSAGARVVADLVQFLDTAPQLAS